MSETVSTHYRLIFIPTEDYLLLKECLDKQALQTYQALQDQGVENFSIGASSVVYIPDAHRDFMNKKAKTGEAI